MVVDNHQLTTKVKSTPIKKGGNYFPPFPIKPSSRLLHHQLFIDFSLAVGAQNLHEIQAGLQGRDVEDEFFLALTFGFGADALAEATNTALAPVPSAALIPLQLPVLVGCSSAAEAAHQARQQGPQ